MHFVDQVELHYLTLLHLFEGFFSTLLFVSYFGLSRFPIWGLDAPTGHTLFLFRQILQHFGFILRTSQIFGHLPGPVALHSVVNFFLLLYLMVPARRAEGTSVDSSHMRMLLVCYQFEGHFAAGWLHSEIWS